MFRLTEMISSNFKYDKFPSKKHFILLKSSRGSPNMTIFLQSLPAYAKLI